MHIFVYDVLLQTDKKVELKFKHTEIYEKLI